MARATKQKDNGSEPLLPDACQTAPHGNAVLASRFVVACPRCGCLVEASLKQFAVTTGYAGEESEDEEETIKPCLVVEMTAVALHGCMGE